MRAQAAEDRRLDVIITEIGGTVGDIESLPFLEAARQVRQDVGRDNVFFVHVSLVPYLAPERRAQDQADAALGGRAAQHRHPARRDRLPRRPRHPRRREAQDRADVRRRRARPSSRRSTRRRIYDIPKVLHREGLDAYVVRRLGLAFRDVAVGQRGTSCCAGCTGRPSRRGRPRGQVRRPAGRLPVGDRGPARRRLRQDARVELRWVASDTCETPEGARRMLSGVDAVCIPGGFGVRGIEGKVGALRWARENQVPALGLCLGLQCMVIEFARNVAGLRRREQHRVRPADAVPGDRDDGRSRSTSSRARATWAARCGSARIRPCSPRGRSSARCTARAGRGAAPAPVRGQQRLPAASSRRPVWSSPASRRTARWSSSSSCPREVHPYYVATQAHPEFKSRPDRAHPLFAGLVGPRSPAQSAQRLLEVVPAGVGA